jgi:protein TonB
LALALHGLLFTVRFEGPQAKLELPPKPLTLSLVQIPNEPLSPLAVSKTPEPPDPSPVHPLPLNEEKPQRQKAAKREKPLKSSGPPVSPRQESPSPSLGSAAPAGEEVPETTSFRESASPATASLGEGGQGAKPALVSEATPLYRRNPVPEYPLAARKRGFQGTVVLEVHVDRQGRVADLRLSASSGYSVLDQAAMASVKTWLFDPGTRGGEKADMWVKVPVRFKLE